MKKLLIGLTLLLGVSVVGASASFGYVLRNEINTYNVSDEYLLQKESLKKVYIDSSIPVRLCMTQGQPRIELRSKGTGVFIEEPGYRVEVRAEGDTSYINIGREQQGRFGMFFGGDTEEAVIYLAQQDMDKLSLKANNYYDQAMFQMEEVNIKEVAIDTRYSNVELSGNFEKIEINKSGGSVKIQSNSPVEFICEGQTALDLRGQFERINLYNHSGRVKVDSVIPTNIEILGQAYYGQGQELILKGAYKNIDVNVHGGEVMFNLTTAPERINVLGEVGRVQIGLPKDIKGYTVVKKTPYNDYQGDYYEERHSTIQSEFQQTETQFRQDTEIASYGDQSIKVLVEGYESEIIILQQRQN